jgi:hypothetical protein
MVLVLLALTWSGLPGAATADEPNQAALAILFPEGRTETRCIAFEEDTISGADLLDRSGLNVITDASSGMGITVCRVEGIGCAYPAENCFCQCMTGSGCAYWNYYYRDPGESDWTYSPLGALLREIGSGSVEAWVWGDGHTPPSADLTFESICAPSTPPPTITSLPPSPSPAAKPVTPPATQPPPLAEAPTEASSEVLSAEPSPTPSPSVPPTQAATKAPVATVSLDTATSGEVNTDPTLFSYWPFGLMLLGLAAIGGIVWLRRS